MKQIIFNEDGLTIDEIDSELKKVRAIVLNSEKKALLVKYAGLYMFPGGSVDKGESEKEALKREILEESGIEIQTDDIGEPFLQIQSLNKNYYDRVMKQNINRLTQTTYYILQTDLDIDETRKKLTESEKEKGHQISFANLSVIQYLVQTNLTNNSKKREFDKEILTALKEFAKLQEKDNDQEQEK